MGIGLILQLLATLLLGGIAFVIIDRKLGQLRYARRHTVPGDEVPGEAEQIYAIADDMLGMPFVYMRLALFGILMLFGLMVINNINETYRPWNFTGCALIILLATMLLRWKVVLGAMLAGSFENWLASTKEKPEDLTEGALEGLYFLLKAMGYAIVGVWILSIILALVPFKDAPMTFPLLLLGSCGFLLYTALRGWKSAVWVRDILILGIFLGVIALGIAIYFDLSLSSVTTYLTGFNLPLRPILFLALLGAGIYFVNTNKKRGR